MKGRRGEGSEKGRLERDEGPGEFGEGGGGGGKEGEGGGDL